MSRIVTHTLHRPLADSQPRMIGDMGDQAVNNLSTHLDITTANIISKVRGMGADAPLAQLRREGKAGIDCNDCGAPIPEARLKALPGAERCRDCEENREERSRRMRRPRC